MTHVHYYHASVVISFIATSFSTTGLKKCERMRDFSYNFILNLIIAVCVYKEAYCGNNIENIHMIKISDSHSSFDNLMMTCRYIYAVFCNNRRWMHD